MEKFRNKSDLERFISGAQKRKRAIEAKINELRESIRSIVQKARSEKRAQPMTKIEKIKARIKVYESHLREIIQDIRRSREQLKLL